MARTSPLIQPTHRPYPRGYQPLPPQKPVNAHPSNAIYAAGTGSGTGTAAKKIGYQNRDGTRSPVSALGGPTGPLSQPMPRMITSATGQRQKNIAQAKADGTFGQKQLAYNQANPGLHMDAGGNIYEHPEAEKRLAASKNNGNDIPLDGKGGYAKPKSPLTTPSSTAGQAQSMRESMAPNPGQDRYGRTSASPSAGGKPVAPSSPLLSSSARGDWQQGTPGTRFMSDKYGAGSSKITTQADRASNVANAVNSTGGTFQKVAAGVSAAAARPSSPILPDGVGAASTRSPGAPTSPQMAGKQPAYTPKPSAVPAEDLKRYADAYEKVKAQEAKTAASNAGGAPYATGKLNGRSMLADQTGGSGVMGGMKAPQATASSPLMTPSTRPQTPAMASTPTPLTPQPPAASTANAPAQTSGPSEQDIKAQEEKAAASQRGYVGNAAKAVGDTTKAVVDAVPKIAGQVVDAGQKTTSQMIEGAKKGFTQMGKDAFGTNEATAETKKLEEMKRQAAGRVTELNGKPYKSPLASDMGLPPPGQNGPMDTAAKNAARGFNDAADLARYKAEDAASGTSPLLQSSSPPQGDSQMADTAAAEEEARRLKEWELVFPTPEVRILTPEEIEKKKRESGF